MSKGRAGSAEGTERCAGTGFAHGAGFLSRSSCSIREKLQSKVYQDDGTIRQLGGDR
jgi:hypothetical protein